MLKLSKFTDGDAGPNLSTYPYLKVCANQNQILGRLEISQSYNVHFLFDTVLEEKL